MPHFKLIYETPEEDKTAKYIVFFLSDNTLPRIDRKF